MLISDYSLKLDVNQHYIYFPIERLKLARTSNIQSCTNEESFRWCVFGIIHVMISNINHNFKKAEAANFNRVTPFTCNPVNILQDHI